MVDIALIGAGRIGKIHGGNLARQAGMRLRYVCDAVPQAASELAAKRRLDAGEIGEVELLSITSRDPAPPPIAYIERSGGVFKDQLIHDFDVCRWILGDEAETVYAAASCLVDPAIAKAGDVDTTAVT